jgi:putative acetyltransferase
MIKIRGIRIGDERELWQLKMNTIKSVNVKDYPQEQIKAWAPDEYIAERWLKRARDMAPFVAEIEGKIVGFADLQDDGYIDHFFCHSEYQGRGIGRVLMQHIVNKGNEKSMTRIYSHVSITAKPFFEAFGFSTIKQQAMKIGNQALANYLMERVVDN